MEKISQSEVNDVLKVWDFLEFQNSYRGYYLNGYTTPDLINRSMQNITMNPTSATLQEILNALNSPKESEELLRNYSTSLENNNMYYKRLIRYIGDLPAFNLTFDCINIKNISEYNSKEYKEDLYILEDFLNRFDCKDSFKTVIRQLVRQGVFYSVLRDEGQKYVLQELPSDFCKITGKSDYGLLFDFNMTWFFANYGVDINMYPRVFKSMYRNVFKKISERYNPAKKPEYRNTTFNYWVQCSPRDGFWAWKISPEITTLIPYFSPLFPDIELQGVVRGLQEDKYFIEASKLLVGILGMNKDNKSGNVANQINITPDILGQFLGLARQGLNKQIGLTALPVDDIKVVEFDTKERNMMTEHIKNITDQSIASSASLLDDNKLSVHQSKLASAIDNNFLESMYPMFANFVEYYVNNRTKKYKFKIRFNDFNTPDDESKRKEALSLYNDKGATNWELMARISNKNIFEYKRQIEQEHFMFKDINNLFVPLTNIYTQSGNQNDIGRKKEENSENESTIASQERESNELKDE